MPSLGPLYTRVGRRSRGLDGLALQSEIYRSGLARSIHTETHNNHQGGSGKNSKKFIPSAKATSPSLVLCGAWSQTHPAGRSMPNFFSAFTTEVFRPIVTLLIPGAIGISTWLIALVWHFTALRRLVSDNHTESAFIILLAMIFGGLVFEDFGARWEVWLDKRADLRSDGLHSRQWFEYLRNAYRSEPIGRRYLRTLVLRLKFELGVAFAMASAGLGLICLAFMGLAYRVASLCELVCVLFIVWGLIEACQTHKVLGRIRAELLDEIRIVG
jgi:hypothetical protein